MDELNVQYRLELETVNNRLGDVEQEQAAIKTAVNQHTSTLSRIERKLDNPKDGPSWVAIAGLVASIGGLLSAAILSFIILKTDPIVAAVLEEAEERKVEVQQLESQVSDGIINDKLMYAQQQENAFALRRTEQDIGQLYIIQSQRRAEQTRALNQEIIELKRSLERATIKNLEKAAGKGN